MPRKYLTALSAVFLLLFFVQSASAAQDQWQGVSRIVAVGDIHGDYDRFKEVLTQAGLINARGNWIGAETHFVQVGDLPDRGPDTDKIIEHMQRLERQAIRDGGRVHALIGNHEAMNVLGDLRYVHPGEYEALKSRQASRLHNNLYDRHIELVTAANPEFVADAAYRTQFDALYPLGYVEHRLAWGQQGEFGAWVMEHNAIIKINRTLFLHGGISPEVLGRSITEINEQIRLELQGNLGEEVGLIEAESGPLWYRGLAAGDEALEQAHVEAVLDFYQVDQIVLGHTPGLGTIVPRFDGKVVVIDTGISGYYGGHLASLLIESGQSYTVQAGQRLAIPENRQDLLAYFKSVLEFKPDMPALQQHVRNIESSPPSPATPAVIPDPAF